MKFKKLVVSGLLLSVSPAFSATHTVSAKTDVFAPTPSSPITSSTLSLDDISSWWAKRITCSGEIDSAAFFSNYTPTTRGVIPTAAGTSPGASNLAITFANLQADAALTDWLSTTLAISYQQSTPSFIRSAAGGGNVLFVNQGYVTIAKPSASPFYFMAGRKFIDFGGLDNTSYLESTYQLLTLNRATEVATGFKDAHGFNGSVYTFTGLTNVNSRNTGNINSYGAALGYGFSDQSYGINVGLGYLNDILSGLYISSTVANASTLNAGNFHTALPAVDLHAKVNLKAFDVSAKYAAAVRRASVLDVPFTVNGGTTFKGAEPAAWGVNLGYTFNIRAHKTRLGAGYQGSHESAALGTASGSVANAVSGVYGTFYAIGMPLTRYYANYSVDLVKWANLGFEYAHDIGYGVSHGGTGRSSDTGVAMISARF